MPSRNDPCPCGSGKKYKRCCLAVDEAMSAPLRLIRDADVGDTRTVDLRSADIPAEWEADLVPAAIAFADTPDARPTVAVVTAGGLVIHVDVIAKSPSEIADIAAVLLEAVDRAIDATGRRPATVNVRYAVLADAMRDGMLERGMAVEVAPLLPGVDDAVDHLERNVFGAVVDAGGPRLSRPQTWSAWGAPPAVIAQLFAAAAELARAEPWAAITDEDALIISLPTGRRWAVCVLGAAGEEFGLALYGDEADLVDLFERDIEVPAEAFASLRGPAISLLYEHRDDVPSITRREVRAAGWEVADVHGYPVLLAMNTPGGGMTLEQFEDLVVVAGAVTRFASQYPDPFETWSETAVELGWTDATTGATVSYDGPRGSIPPAQWPEPEILGPCGPQGPNARHGAFYPLGTDLDEMADVDQRVVDDFEDWLQTAGSGRRGLSARTARGHARAAAMFVDYLVYGERVPLAAVTELDLRVFIYERYLSRASESAAQATALPGSLERFFGYLAEEKGIVCPWSGEILRDRVAYDARRERAQMALTDPNAAKAWLVELWIDLDARCLLPAATDDLPSLEDPATLILGDDVIERGRRWLVWRDEEIARGVVKPEELRERLVARRD
jgi:hypothetical protein